MLTARPLTNAQQAAVYFESDDYYVDGEQLSPSSWWGEGARRLGLRGEVDRDLFAGILAGRLPNGVVLEKGGGGTHRPGDDLVFSAPKSVSLLALVHGDRRVLRAHEEAVTTALEYLERNASRVRIKRNGRVEVHATDNLLVARFNHDSSRAMDPQLHTHGVILNATRREDGSWKALSNSEIYRSQKAGGAIYRAELARRLRELGYTIERTHVDGRFEVRGFDADALAAFSRRRAQIVEHLERLGFEGPKAADVAARATRDKKRDVRRDVLLADWRQRAAELAIDFDAVRSKPRRTDLGQDRVAADHALEHAIAHLTERSAVAAERHLVQVALGFGVGEVGLDDLQRAIERRIDRRELIPAVSSKRKDPFARQFTTDRALAIEQDLLYLAEKSRGRAAPIAASQEIDTALEAIDRQGPFALTRDQANAVRLILSTSDRVAGIQGYAGTGKTTGALLHIRRIAESHGFEVRGFAPSAAAAQILSRDAGIPSMTLAKFLRRVRSEDRPKNPQLWVVDESSMMGNAAARSLLAAADRAGARVVLVGDRDQLPSIEAGRAFGLLMDRGLAVAKIETIVRQKDRELREAVVQTIAREHEKAVDLLGPRITTIPDRTARLRAVAQAYLDLPEQARRETLVLTSMNSDRRTLNELIREGLIERGALGADRAQASILVAKDLTKAELLDPRSYEPDDTVRFGRRYKRLRLEKDAYLTVRAVDVERGIVRLATEDGRELDWNPKNASKVEVYQRESRTLYVGDLVRWTRNDAAIGQVNGEIGRVVSIDLESRTADLIVESGIRRIALDRDLHLEHGYASTVHAAQGRTAERVLFHVDAGASHMVGHEGWYVAISRAAGQLLIYTDSVERLPREIRKTLAQESALEFARPRSEIEPSIQYGFEIGR